MGWDDPFLLAVLAVGLAAGAIASVAGFGIGSLLTPLLAVPLGTKLAVAVVAGPHFLGTFLRFAMLRRHVSRRVLLGFGVMSALGGLLGALLHSLVAGPALGLVLGALLVFAGASGLTGLSDRLRFRGAWAWGAGAASGLFGGLVGNQGGIRSAALLNFELSKEAFVATATAVALMVDLARLPVYLITQGVEIAEQWPALAVATAGVIAGTLLGQDVLSRIPEPVFRRVVAGIILALGVALLAGLGR